jgi:hypothetical protein
VIDLNFSADFGDFGADFGASFGFDAIGDDFGNFAFPDFFGDSVTSDFEDGSYASSFASDDNRDVGGVVLVGLTDYSVSRV